MIKSALVYYIESAKTWCMDSSILYNSYEEAVYAFSRIPQYEQKNYRIASVEFNAAS